MHRSVVPAFSSRRSLILTHTRHFWSSCFFKTEFVAIALFQIPPLLRSTARQRQTAKQCARIENKSNHYRIRVRTRHPSPPPRTEAKRSKCCDTRTQRRRRLNPPAHRSDRVSSFQSPKFREGHRGPTRSYGTRHPLAETLSSLLFLTRCAADNSFNS